ncbi:helix-turn-helix domain-containing protein [Chitinophaga sp. Hz27]|uniref:helix-turn-helix domain-containing protein n=1 Tax=Chitinophaga sp. Hz27 TaxID=3347169 RepID=UPI0035DA299B
MDYKKYILESTGKAIRRHRTTMRLTLLDLEEATGISKGDLSLIERGKKNVEFTTIVRIAFSLGIQVSDLYRITFPEEKAK